MLLWCLATLQCTDENELSSNDTPFVRFTGRICILCPCPFNVATWYVPYLSVCSPEPESTTYLYLNVTTWYSQHSVMSNPPSTYFKVDVQHTLLMTRMLLDALATVPTAKNPTTLHSSTETIFNQGKIQRKYMYEFFVLLISRGGGTWYQSNYET